MEIGEIRDGNFLSLYIYQAGLGNTPKQWHFWSAVSLLCATVGNNLWLNITGVPLYPNQYIFLVGASGVGKGDAIVPAASFVGDDDPYIHKHCTDNMTKQGVMDHLRLLEPAVPSVHIHGSRMWLVTDELGDAMPAGPLGMEFIKGMTNLYMSKRGKNWDMTRGGGSQHVKDPMLNWLAGSTEDWLFASLDPTAVSGGFFARTLVIYGEKVTDYPAPSFPHDRVIVQSELLERIEIFRRVNAEMVFDPEAWQVYHDWYNNRPRSDDPDKDNIHNRDNTMVWKLSMISCLSEQPLNHTGHFNRMIQTRNVIEATEWVQEARKDLDKILAQAHRSRETIAMDKTLDIIRAHGTIQRSNLLKKLDKLGVRSPELNSIVMTLKERNQIDETRTKTQATMYSVKKRAVPKDDTTESLP